MQRTTGVEAAEHDRHRSCRVRPPLQHSLPEAEDRRLRMVDDGAKTVRGAAGVAGGELRLQVLERDLAAFGLSSISSSSTASFSMLFASTSRTTGAKQPLLRVTATDVDVLPTMPATIRLLFDRDQGLSASSRP